MPSETLHLTLPVPPSVNRIWRRSGSGGMYKVPAAVQYEAAATAVMVAAGLRLNRPRWPRGDVAVVAVWYRARRHGDTDNRLKLLLDAGNKMLWHDDAQVTDVRLIRRDDDPKHARVELWAMPAHAAAAFALPLVLEPVAAQARGAA